MNNHELKIKTTKNAFNGGGTEYKVIEIKGNDLSENLYAVVTPIKMK